MSNKEIDANDPPDPAGLAKPDAGREPLAHVRIPFDVAIEEAHRRATQLQARRSVREFSREPVPRALLVECLRAALCAPSGANMQPWTFVVVTDPDKKREIRAAVEREERAFYEGRASDKWLKDLAQLGTHASKPYLEEAPALIVVFAHVTRPEGEANYYVKESVGIAVGFLLTALHQAGLCALTHTPSRMRFLEELLARPPHERAFLLIPVGLPADGCTVPRIERRAFDASVTFVGE